MVAVVTVEVLAQEIADFMARTPPELLAMVAIPGVIVLLYSLYVRFCR